MSTIIKIKVDLEYQISITEGNLKSDIKVLLDIVSNSWGKIKK